MTQLARSGRAWPKPLPHIAVTIEESLFIFSKLCISASNKRANFFFQAMTSHNLNTGYRSTFECAIKATIVATIFAAYLCAISRTIGQSISFIGIFIISSPSIFSDTDCSNSCPSATSHAASYLGNLDTLDGSPKSGQKVGPQSAIVIYDCHSNQRWLINDWCESSVIANITFPQDQLLFFV